MGGRAIMTVPATMPGMDHPAAPATTTYDEVPYESHPFAQTHPDRLATLARLMGLQPPPVARCRVLELGCAAGGNLLPMAVALPQAQFVGVDLSAVQIAQGQRAVDALGLTNVQLHAMSITEVDASFGEFDYILSHGVYSWVPDAVQQAILRVSADRLHSDGVAYVSYNTLPGWRMRGMVRDLMRYHAMPFADPTQRVAQARAILGFLANAVPAQGNAYGILLHGELQALAGAVDHYILHEHLEDTNEPVYFHEFAARAARQGLQYLGEADFSAMLAANFEPEVAQTLLRIAPDLIRQEQFMDFLRNRTFRQTLLVHEGAAPQRHVTPERLQGLWVASALQPAQAGAPAAGIAVTFRATDGGTLTTPNAVTQAAIALLGAQWPVALAFDDLLQRAVARLQQLGIAGDMDGLSAREVLGSDMLQCQTAGLVELRTRACDFTLEPGACPLASPLARWQASQGLATVTSLRHERVAVDAQSARLLQLLDGRHDRNAVCRQLMGGAAGVRGLAPLPPAAVPRATREAVDRAIEQMARAALLMREPA